MAEAAAAPGRPGRNAASSAAIATLAPRRSSLPCSSALPTATNSWVKTAIAAASDQADRPTGEERQVQDRASAPASRPRPAAAPATVSATSVGRSRGSCAAAGQEVRRRTGQPGRGEHAGQPGQHPQQRERADQGRAAGAGDQDGGDGQRGQRDRAARPRCRPRASAPGRWPCRARPAGLRLPRPPSGRPRAPAAGWRPAGRVRRPDSSSAAIRPNRAQTCRKCSTS